MHKGHYRYNKRFKPFKFCFMLLNVDFKDFFHWRRAIKSKSHRLIYIIRIVSAVEVGGKKFNIFGIIVVYCCWSERRGLWEERKRTAKWKESKNTKIDGLHPGVEEGKNQSLCISLCISEDFLMLIKAWPSVSSLRHYPSIHRHFNFPYIVFNVQLRWTVHTRATAGVHNKLHIHIFRLIQKLERVSSLKIKARF